MLKQEKQACHVLNWLKFTSCRKSKVIATNIADSAQLTNILPNIQTIYFLVHEALLVKLSLDQID